MAIAISIKLQVLPGNLIMVPGSEPSTSLTSTNMEAQMRAAGVQVPAVVDLAAALEAIPGSRVIFMKNTSSPVQKFLELPSQEITCPCQGNVDYYAILRGLSRSPNANEVDALNEGSCDVDPMGVFFGG